MDRMASNGFEGIAQMLLEQKKLMDALEAENRELRRQINDLRRGVGIAIVIEGKTIQLANENGSSIPNTPQSQAALQSLQGSSIPSSSANNYNSPTGRPTNGQPQINNNNNDKRENNVRSPLADSFVL